MDKDTRNRLQKATQAARGLLEQDFEDQLAGVFDIQPDGTIGDAPGDHLDAVQRVARRKLLASVAHLQANGQTAAEAVASYRREAVFTTLNRFVALKMLEARGLVQECISRGEQSSGFKEFCGLAPGLVQLPDRGYRLYLESLFDEIGREVRVLFDRRDPASLLWPGRTTLFGSQQQRGLLDILNDPELAGVWEQDETIGWVYQYYNDPSERKRMRDESGAPRNSRELAVRNQFFTPRYVVEFLTDNSLGRTWYEMTRGETCLKEQCRYLMRRPNEIFLGPDEAPSPQEEQADGLSQQAELLQQQPAEIPYRLLKDPREIRMLDPACGSMHFGLYAFDLFQVIYEEAWEREIPSANDGRIHRPLRELYATQDDYRHDIPRLIIEHNIFGIDIDPRAAQIAGLSLWLRAQRAWQVQGLSRQERPRIRRSNIVCAESMPGESAYLDEFMAAHLSDTPENQVLGGLLRKVFKSMELAGEAGSLLKIEDEIVGVVAEARRQWLAPRKPEQLPLFGDDAPTPEQLTLDLDVSGITDAAFWADAEARIYMALRDYAERTEHSGGYQRRLFADDAARGFAFIDLCRQRYDVVLMNPPFGDASLPSKPYIEETYGDTKGDVYKAFVECFQSRLVPAGYLGIISSRTGFFLGQSEDWRTRVVLRLFRPIVLADLGSGVLDAMVEVAAYVLRSLSEAEARDLTLSLVPVLDRVARDKQDRFSLPKWQAARDGLKRHQAVAELEHLEAHGFIQRSAGDIVRYVPFWQAVRNVEASPEAVFPPLVCVRVLADENKGGVLADALYNPTNNRLFVADPAKFREVPSSPFAYWVSDRVRLLFQMLPKAESKSRRFTKGLCTTDDERFLRTHWEVTVGDRGTSAEHFEASHFWASFAKGGEAKRFYTDIVLVLKWAANGAELKAFLDWKIGKEGQWSRWINSVGYYFRPGLTWPLRAFRFSPQALPAGCIFSVRGYAAFAPRDDLRWLLGLTGSSAFDFLFKTLLGRFGFPEFVVGALQQLPVPNLSHFNAARLGELTATAWAEKRQLDSVVATSHAFVAPALLTATGTTVADLATAWAARVRASEATVAAIQAEIDDLAFRLYGLDEADRAALTITLATETSGDTPAEAGEGEEDDAAASDAPALVADLLAYVVGCAFGRWDIRYATDERPAPEAPDPFAPLPICPPGQLQNAQGLPAAPEDVPVSYPIAIPWDGVLMDDAGHERDVVARSREVFDIIFGDGAEAAWREAAELLECCGDDLRAWFARSLFADHLKRYSKSRRKAPIYWQLATPSASYSVWLYYHRFTKDTFYKVLHDFVAPKLQHEERKLAGLIQDFGGNPTASQRKELAEQESLVEELRAFREEIARVAPLWNPDLNDGVLINFAPLWRLVPQHRAWQKECKDCWDKLAAGDYDWSHLAMHLWPERVVPKCAKDRSLAIAHGLEEVFWEENDDGKWRSREVLPSDLERIVAERSSAAVKDALKSLLEAPAPVTGRGGGRQASGRSPARRTASVSRAGDGGSGDGRASVAASPDAAALDTVRQAIAADNGGLGKSEVLAATGLDETQWNTAINALLAEGVVKKTGAGRGMRYHLTGND
jgi:hypothetical protein